jgi:subtilisin family serine protease
MYRLAAALVVVLGAASLVGGAAAQPEAGADRYVVVLKTAVNPSAVASLHAARYGAQVEFVYGHALAGYSAVIPAHRLAEVRADENVAYVEADGEMSVVAQTLPWGIDKIDADVSSTRAGDGSGAVTNVNAYIIDTGVDYGHADLNASASRHVNFANGPNKDCHGHGTHVAGTVGAADNALDVVGVAPSVTLWGVKVLGCGGTGSNAGVIAGIDWVTANAIKPAVANMSLGGSLSKAVNDAVIRSANSGVFYALAAGNSGAHACNASPAAAGAGTNNGIMTVAATDSADMEASWSNYGSCVDIWAPGVSILSTRKGGGTTTMSGTSMASPHGAGGGALYLSGHTSAGPASVEGALKAAATDTGRSSKDGRRIMREYVGGF